MNDDQHIRTACAIADAYNAHLKQLGLPTYSGWNKLPCDTKIMALATVFGAGTVSGIAEAAAFVVAVVHVDSELSWLKNTVASTLGRLPKLPSW